eukprot:scaffold5493_cov52-Attheya_sp.AAC.9
MMTVLQGRSHRQQPPASDCSAPGTHSVSRASKVSAVVCMSSAERETETSHPRQGTNQTSSLLLLPLTG